MRAACAMNAIGGFAMLRRSTASALTGVFLLATLAPAANAQDRRVVTQPATPAPPYCQVLHANLARLSPTAFVPPRAFDGAIENTTA